MFGDNDDENNNLGVLQTHLPSGEDLDSAKYSPYPELDKFGVRKKPALGDVWGETKYRDPNLSPEERRIEEAQRIRAGRFEEDVEDELCSLIRKGICLAYHPEHQTAEICVLDILLQHPSRKHITPSIPITGEKEMEIIRLLRDHGNDATFEQLAELLNQPLLSKEQKEAYRQAVFRLSKKIEETWGVKEFVKVSKQERRIWIQK